MLNLPASSPESDKVLTPSPSSTIFNVPINTPPAGTLTFSLMELFESVMFVGALLIFKVKDWLKTKPASALFKLKLKADVVAMSCADPLKKRWLFLIEKKL